VIYDPMAMSAPPALHELEAEVMEEMWRLERATVRDVMEAVNARSPKPRAYTTFMTIMTRLDGKGLLQREREGKTDIYWPRLDRESYLEQRAQAEVQQLLADYGDHALVNFARAMQTLDPARVRALRRLAARD
jgi:BlaI family transcriptional regulator, penicillinase repressor